MAFTAQLFSVKPFAGQQLQARSRASAVVRAPVVACQAQQPEEAVSGKPSVYVLFHCNLFDSLNIALYTGRLLATWLIKRERIYRLSS